MRGGMKIMLTPKKETKINSPHENNILLLLRNTGEKTVVIKSTLEPALKALSNGRPLR